jgi:amino acid adenylation domain-containing protein
MSGSTSTLISGILGSTGAFPDRPALVVEKRSYTYNEFLKIASSFAVTLDENAIPGEQKLTAIYASRSLTAYAGIIATFLRGYGYVPLNPMHPAERSAGMLKQCECRAIIVDGEASKNLDGIIGGIERQLVVFAPDCEDVDELRTRFPQHRILGGRDRVDSPLYDPRPVSDDSLAYVMFTSGSTGTPKGVMIAHRNLLRFVEFMAERYEVTPEDRLSQTFSLTFDPSVFDMFVAWSKGACVCCPSQKDLLNPAKFINGNKLTIWYSVPSLIYFMKHLRSLKANGFPSLRASLFAGEPLPEDLTRAWAEAAPQSIIDNLYGPTEMTVTVTYYRWNEERSKKEGYRGIVPIGYPNPGMKALVCDAQLHEVASGQQGELLMAGPQVSPGYWKDPGKTEKAFVVPPGQTEIYYRTGDLVRRPIDGGPICYVGRIDSQLKIRGQRVELGEIEAVIREESGIDRVVAMGWPLAATGAQGVEVFLEGKETDVEELRKRISTRLPDYMIPRKFRFVRGIPLNENGKCDRRALQTMLEEEK